MSREVFPEGSEGFVQRASRSFDKDLAMDFTVRDLAAEKARVAESRRSFARPSIASAKRAAERPSAR